jgi:hypothetical protein
LSVFTPTRSLILSLDRPPSEPLTLTDLRWLIEMVMGARTPDLPMADLTGDGKVSLGDVRELVRLWLSS